MNEKKGENKLIEFIDHSEGFQMSYFKLNNTKKKLLIRVKYKI